MTLEIGAVFIGLVLGTFLGIRFFENKRIQALNNLAANFDVRDIESALVLWKAENPDKSFSDPEAQKIIRECIRKMNRYKDANPDIDAEKNIAKLIGLLN